MSHVHRLRDADRIFFVTVNLRRALGPLRPGEYGKLIAATDASHAKLGFKRIGDVYASESGAQRIGDEAGGMAMVELQQLFD